jgi:mono/diheme cytochrome c family protein
MRAAKAQESGSKPISGSPSFSDFAVPPKPEVTPAFLKHGQELYAQNCAACHGANGDGKSDAAAFLLPKPRNFVEPKYRLKSTKPGQLPTDVDLFRSISLGMPGTAMPPWRYNLSDNDRWALVEHIKSYSPRFASRDEEQKILDLGTPPLRNSRSLEEGKTLYAKMSCNACHGENGRGDGVSAASLVDDSGGKIKPRDFTRAGAFKSGYSTKDMVRTILGGFEGTPMMGFETTIAKDDAWKIAYYLETLGRNPASVLARSSQNFLIREEVGEPDVRIKVTERAWKYDPEIIRVRKGQVVELTFEPTDNGLGVGHGLAISSYDEVAFINGAMVGVPKTVKFRADRPGRFTIYCSTQCSTEKLHPLMNGTFLVEEGQPLAAVN